MQPNEISEVLDRPLSREVLARDLTRLGYVAKDGTPRTVPIAAMRIASGHLRRIARPSGQAGRSRE